MPGSGHKLPACGDSRRAMSSPLEIVWETLGDGSENLALPVPAFVWAMLCRTSECFHFLCTELWSSDQFECHGLHQLHNTLRLHKLQRLVRADIRESNPIAPDQGFVRQACFAP